MKSKRTTHKRRVLRRYSAEDREQLIRKYHSSGQSQSAYCRDHQINLNTFCGWLNRRPASAGSFAEIAVRGASVGERIDVCFPDGVRVSLPAQYPPEQAARFIREVLSC